MKLMSSNFMINQYSPVSFKENGTNLDDTMMQYAVSKCKSYLQGDTPLEYVVVLQKRVVNNGKIKYEKRGEALGTSTNLSFEELKRIIKGEKGVIIVHGHPEESDGTTTPVSLGDFLKGSMLDASEFIAVNKLGDISRIQIPEGNVSQKLNQLAGGDYRDLYCRFVDVSSEKPKDIDNFWLYVSKELGIEYHTDDSFFNP